MNLTYLWQPWILLILANWHLHKFETMVTCSGRIANIFACWCNVSAKINGYGNMKSVATFFVLTIGNKASCQPMAVYIHHITRIIMCWRWLFSQGTTLNEVHWSSQLLWWKVACLYIHAYCVMNYGCLFQLDTDFNTDALLKWNSNIFHRI